MATTNINGRDYTYAEGDRWLVEIGKGSGSYRTKYALASPNQAVWYFNAINIGRGFKKRLTLEQSGVKVKIAYVMS
jgi:hypothetical protein